MNSSDDSSIGSPLTIVSLIVSRKTDLLSSSSGVGNRALAEARASAMDDFFVESSLTRNWDDTKMEKSSKFLCGIAA